MLARKQEVHVLAGDAGLLAAEAEESSVAVTLTSCARSGSRSAFDDKERGEVKHGVRGVLAKQRGHQGGIDHAADDARAALRGVLFCDGSQIDDDEP